MTKCYDLTDEEKQRDTLRRTLDTLRIAEGALNRASRPMYAAEELVHALNRVQKSIVEVAEMVR